MKITGQRLRWAHVALLAAFILAGILRTHKWNELTVFNGDDGMDLSVVWHMEHRGHRPLVGPFLSVADFYTPPTYYYLTWFFYHFAPDPNGVRTGYFFMDILSMAVLVYLVSKIGGTNAAAITGILYAATRVLMYHGRAYWQPFPLQFFLALSLLCVWLAYRKTSIILLWIATAFYATALSVYPSPIILLPLILHHLFMWHRTVKKIPPLHAAVYSLIILGCTTAVIYAPQLIFEGYNGFPTFHILASANPADITVLQRFQTILFHAATSVTNVIQNQNLLPGPFRYVLPFIYIFLLFITHRFTTKPTSLYRKKTLDVAGFFPPLIVFSGYLFTFFIPDPAPHRVWAVIPVIIVSTALITEKALRSGFVPAAGAVIIIFLYLWGNVSGIYIDYAHPPTDAIGLTKRIAGIIMQDMEQSKVTQNNMQLIYMLPDNATPHYELNRILYWMIAAKKLDIPLATEGNKLDYEVYTLVATQPTVYLLCHQFMTPEKTNHGCLTPFAAINPAYSISGRHDHPLLSLIILKRNESPEVIEQLQREPVNKQ